ncbi:MAG: hypothetical protein ACI4EA_09535, partial [Candidatus Ornithomonoglobus sp.]
GDNEMPPDPPGNGDNGMPPGPPPGISSEDAETYIRINGGNIVIHCGGDGIDSNCDLEINGGDIIITGPRPGADSALDFDGELLINGGTVLTAGSSGMNETPSEESKQNSIWLIADNMDAGAFIEIACNGETIHSFNADEAYNLILVSSDKFVQGNEYIFYINGEQLAAVTVEGRLTSAGNSDTGGGGAPPGNGDNGMPPGPPPGNGDNGMPPGQPPEMDGNGGGNGPPPGMDGNGGGNGAPPEIQRNASGLSALITDFVNIKIIPCFIIMLAALLFMLVYKRRY